MPGKKSKKFLENAGYATGGLAIALLLLWLGATNKGNDRGEWGVLVAGLVFAVLSIVSFVGSARRRG
jgi:threonine/homoserine efflux transporter RhtA